MVESLAKLHCCGAHHHDTHKPAGLNLILGIPGIEAGKKVTVYGTGENEDSAVIIVPSKGTYEWDDLHTQLLADNLARGANITVIVPSIDFAETPEGNVHGTKRSNDEAFAGSASAESALSLPESVEAFRELILHLKQFMNVSFIGLFGLASSKIVREVLQSSDLARSLNCGVVLAEDSMSQQGLAVPCSIIDLSGQADSLEIIEEPILIRLKSLPHSTDHKSLTDTDAPIYQGAMKEVLYFFKRHLHDWS